MDERYWIRSLPWRQKNRAESKSAQVKFAPQLMLSRKDGWNYLELLLVNRSSWTVWAEEANIVLADLRAKWQATAPTGETRYQILHNVGPNETLGLNLDVSIYNAAGRPEGRYSCLVLMNVRYCVFDEWCDLKLETSRVDMAGYTALDLRRARWYDKKIKQINDSVGLTTEKHEV